MVRLSLVIIDSIINAIGPIEVPAVPEQWSHNTTAIERCRETHILRPPKLDHSVHRIVLSGAATYIAARPPLLGGISAGGY